MAMAAGTLARAGASGLVVMIGFALGAIDAHAQVRVVCEASCDYATGANCPVVHLDSLSVFPYDAASLVALETYALTCADAWEGAGGCYESRIRAAVDELIAPSKAIATASDKALFLPDAARRTCEKLEPVNGQRAVDEAAAWCVIGRDECVEGLREAHRVLAAMPAWVACIERMDRYADENERRASRQADCIAARPPEPAPRLPAPTVLPEPERVPKIAEAPRASTPPAMQPEVAPRVTPEPERPSWDAPRVERRQDPAVLEVVRVPRQRQPDLMLANRMPEPKAPRDGPKTDIVANTDTLPPTIDSGQRQGQFELTVAPFSGVLTLRDPATGSEHRPMMASLGLGLDVVVSLSPAFALEVALNARGAFASTALEQAVSVSLDQLVVSTGTAFVVDVEPSVVLLSEYLGIGLVADLRWDTLGVTSRDAGLVSTKSAGSGGGLRLIAGLGLLARELRLVGSVDWMFIGTESTAIRVAIQGEIGPAILTGSYRQAFRLGAEDEAYLVDDMQLTLGYRAVF